MSKAITKIQEISIQTVLLVFILMATMAVHRVPSPQIHKFICCNQDENELIQNQHQCQVDCEST